MMTKRLPAVTMVLVLLVGAGAFAVNDDRLLTGSWGILSTLGENKALGSEVK
ncbi:hypothetical protein KGY77_10210 [Candidatus Bipolaricaulota bacterium]|nr:hypothetical protein [Candidatus Bipolaricaulota bacterium]